jgi:predicted DsbA family dithiol-disulfide isomerase
MNRFDKPLQITLYQDVLCGWCYVAEQRLASLKHELHELVRWRHKPFPLRVNEVQPTPRDVEACAKEIRRARREPEGVRLRADIWTLGDAPRSSVPALAALEAARLQGPSARALLARWMQRVALEQGVNVTRGDVIYELAERVGLDMNRFAAAFTSPETRRLILEEHRLAAGRGVKGVPTLVIGERWMISGLREVEEYRRHILECMEKAGLSGAGEPGRLLH